MKIITIMISTVLLLESTVDWLFGSIDDSYDSTNNDDDNDDIDSYYANDNSNVNEKCI